MGEAIVGTRVVPPPDVTECLFHTSSLKNGVNPWLLCRTLEGRVTVLTPNILDVPQCGLEHQRVQFDPSVASLVGTEGHVRGAIIIESHPHPEVGTINIVAMRSKT